MKVVSIYLVSGLCIRLLAEEERAQELLEVAVGIDNENNTIRVTDNIVVNSAHVTHVEISDPEVKEEVAPEIVSD